MVTIAQCQRLQTAWFAALAGATGGKTFSTHGSTWAWLPARRELMLMFPERVSVSGLRPALAEGTRLGATTVGVWLNGAVNSEGLAGLGFEPGWQPWWMAAPVAAPASYDSGPASLTTEVPEYRGPLAQELRVVEAQPRQAWHAEIRTRDGICGAAYTFKPSGVHGLEGLAGVFNMEVLPGYQRRGFGTALLSRAAEAAAGAGARHLTLNATPEGFALYSQRGFTLVGRGKTHWLAL